MIDKLIKYLNLSEDQLKQFNELKATQEENDKELNLKIKSLMQEKKDSWNKKKQDFENILTQEQKDKMQSLFELFMPSKPFGKSFKKGFWGFKSC